MRPSSGGEAVHAGGGPTVTGGPHMADLRGREGASEIRLSTIGIPRGYLRGKGDSTPRSSDGFEG